MKAKIEAMYLTWYWSFLTISAFADYYCISDKTANRVLDIGKRINYKKRGVKC